MSCDPPFDYTDAGRSRLSSALNAAASRLRPKRDVHLPGHPWLLWLCIMNDSRKLLAILGIVVTSDGKRGRSAVHPGLTLAAEPRRSPFSYVAAAAGP